MSVYSNLRAAMRAAVCVAALLAGSGSPAPAADRSQAQAQLLDQAEFLCANCFFGASTYFYCFAADNQVLIGYQKTPVFNWQDQSKNYLTPVHPAWEAWTASGQTVPISYDREHIWVDRTSAKQDNAGLGSHLKEFAFWISRGNGKQVKLTRRATGDMFSHNASCRQAGVPATH